MRGALKRLAGLVAGAVAALATHAGGAGFDCTKAVDARDRLVCDDASLSALDVELSQAYAQALSILSPAGAAQLRQDQRDWLRYSRQVCPMIRPGGEEALPGTDPKSCLQPDYRARIRQLSQVSRIGPFVFSRHDTFDARPAGDGDLSGQHRGFLTRLVGYAQIDTLHQDEAAAWNLHVRNLVTHDDLSRDCESGGDGDVSFQVQYANHRMISAQRSAWAFCHGSAHGHGGAIADNVILGSSPRKLTARDVFGTGGGWTHGFQQLVQAELSRQGWDGTQIPQGSAMLGHHEAGVEARSLAIHCRGDANRVQPLRRRLLRVRPATGDAFLGSAQTPAGAGCCGSIGRRAAGASRPCCRATSRYLSCPRKPRAGWPAWEAAGGRPPCSGSA